MKIALLGYGRMGHMVEEVALNHGDMIAVTIDAGQEELFNSPAFASSDVAIDFSSPQAAYSLCRKALQLGKPVVSGTTGWNDEMSRLKEEVVANGWTFFHASNFSIGVNLFFELNERLSEMMSRFVPDSYQVSMQETHHVHKLDAPSGTALTIAQGLMEHQPSINDWYMKSAVPVLQEQLSPKSESEKLNSLPITVYREGEVVGEHSVTYTSQVDCLTIEHRAFDRSGFAQGAVWAAHFCQKHQGLLTMKDLLKEY